MPFDVKVERKLSPEMEDVAAAREKVRVTEARIERVKTDLKQAKAEWEEAVAGLNDAIDAAVDAQRQPSLFPAGAGAPEPPPGRAGEAGASSAEAGAAAAGWRGIAVTEALEAHTRVFDAFDACGVETMGQLADRLRAGETFGLRLTDVEDLKEEVEEVEQASCADPEPVSFGAPRCRVCGCTNDDCRQCIEKTGAPCWWVEANLCSACVEPAPKVVDVLNLPKPKRTRKAKAKKS